MKTLFSLIKLLLLAGISIGQGYQNNELIDSVLFHLNSGNIQSATEKFVESSKTLKNTDYSLVFPERDYLEHILYVLELVEFGNVNDSQKLLSSFISENSFINDDAILVLFNFLQLCNEIERNKLSLAIQIYDSGGFFVSKNREYSKLYDEIEDFISHLRSWEKSQNSKNALPKHQIREIYDNKKEVILKWCISSIIARELETLIPEGFISEKKFIAASNHVEFNTSTLKKYLEERKVEAKMGINRELNKLNELGWSIMYVGNSYSDNNPIKKEIIKNLEFSRKLLKKEDYNRIHPLSMHFNWGIEVPIGFPQKSFHSDSWTQVSEKVGAPLFKSKIRKSFYEDFGYFLNSGFEFYRSSSLNPNNGFGVGISMTYREVPSTYLTQLFLDPTELQRYQYKIVNKIISLSLEVKFRWYQIGPTGIYIRVSGGKIFERKFRDIYQQSNSFANEQEEMRVGKNIAFSQPNILMHMFQIGLLSKTDIYIFHIPGKRINEENQYINSTYFYSDYDHAIWGIGAGLNFSTLNLKNKD